MSDNRITRSQANANPRLQELVESYNPYIGGSLLARTPPKPLPSLVSPTSGNNSNLIDLVNSIESSQTAGNSQPSTSIANSTNTLDFDSSAETVRPNVRSTSESSESTHSNIVIMATTYVPIKDALIVVPEFNGKNIPLTDFLEGCNEAKEMVGRDQEKNLLRLIKSKLQGEARQTVRSERIESFADLTKLLKSIYSSPSTVHELIARLGNELQYDDETVISFANRIRDIAKKIIEIKKLDTLEVTEEFTNFVNENVAECFKRGLKLDIEQRLKDNEDIAEIIKDALQIERQFESRKNLKNSRYKPTKKIAMPCQVCLQDNH